MDPYQAWIEQMPREFVRRRIGEIEKQIEELPKELAFLRRLDEMPIPSSGQAAVETRPAHETQPASGGQQPEVTQRPRRRRKMSQERRAIRDAVSRLRPNAGPAEVAEATGQELPAVQKTMSRMARDGQLVRMGYRRYDLPPDDAEATLLGESSPNGTEGAITP